MMRMKANVNMPMYRGGSLDVLLYNLVISARDIVWSAVQKGVAVGVSGVNKLEHLGHELKDAIIDGTDESRKQNEDGNGEPEEVVKVQKIAPIFDHGVHTLLEMASKYPHETFNIISSMAPVRSHRIICRDFKKPDSPMVAKLDEGQYIIATTEDNVPRDVTDDDADDVDEDNDGGPLSLAQRENQDLVNYEGKKDCFRLWYNRHGTYLSSLYASVFGPEEDAEVESFTIEIPYISSLEFLQAVIIIANKTANKEIFNHEVVKVAIFNAWNDFGYAHHMWHFFFFLVGIIVNSVTNYRFLNMVEHEQFNLLYANLGITGLFLIYELVQMYLDIFTYFMSVNNLMDLSAYVLVLAGNVLRTINHRENNLSAALLSVGCLMLYFDFLFYLGPFHSTGYLIGMIKAIMWGIRYYLFILAIVVFGFSQSLFVLSFAGDNQFSTPQMALLSSFTYMMGAASYPDPNGDLLAISPFYPTYINSTNGMNITMTNYSATGYLPQSNGLQISNPELATFLIVMLVFITAIVMLNLLISIMGYEFSRVQEEAEAEWRKEVCNTILDQLRFVKPKVKQFTHFLKRKLDIKKEKEQVKVSSVIGELRDQFYPMKFKSELHRHEMHRMTQDDSGYIRITCNVCFKDIDGEGDDLFYNCKTCVYSTHLHCAMPMVASDVKVDRFAASVDKKIKNMFSEIRDQIYPDTCSCGQEHSADHTLTRSVIKKSTRNPMYCGVCRRGIVGEEDDDLYYGCTSCAFDTHLKCSVSTYRNDSARFSSIEKQLAAIVNHLGVKE